MEKINEKVEWSDVVLLENGVALTGGKDGNANRQAKALANRTAWLDENKAGEVNGKIVREGKVAIEGKDILVQSGRTVQAELDQKSDTDHTHEGGGLAPEIKVEDAGKVLAINKEGTGTEWQVISGNPVGTIIAWAGLTPPAGYLECAGQILKREIYKDLFKAIGTVWGTTAGDNFTLPDFKSAARFLRSRGDGLEVGMTQEDAIRNATGEAWVRAREGSSTGDSLYSPTGVFSRGSNATYLAVNNTSYNMTSQSLKIDLSTCVPTADENRPKNAVVMYCIKAVDEYINPTQMDIAKVAEENAKKANREEIKELAGTRLWVSGEYQPVNSTPTIVTHGLNIDPLKCKCEVLLKCVVAENGYSVGDVLNGWINAPASGNQSPPTVVSGTNTISTTTGALGIYMAIKHNGGLNNIQPANWRYIFRIWY